VRKHGRLRLGTRRRESYGSPTTAGIGSVTTPPPTSSTARPVRACTSVFPSATAAGPEPHIRPELGRADGCGAFRPRNETSGPMSPLGDEILRARSVRGRKGGGVTETPREVAPRAHGPSSARVQKPDLHRRTRLLEQERTHRVPCNSRAARKKQGGELRNLRRGVAPGEGGLGEARGPRDPSRRFHARLRRQGGRYNRISYGG